MRVLKGQKVSILGSVGASDRHHDQVTEIVATADQLGGFIDVKMPTKGRRTLGSWRAWKRHWCTVGRPTGGGDSKSLQLTLSCNGSSNNIHSTIQLPHYATLCRSDSRSRPFAFGIFSSSQGANHRPILFLSGRSETETQLWMARIRTLLAPNILPVLGDEFSVSLIENKYSRGCGLCGVYGVLSLDETEMSIRDPSTGKVSAVWKWLHIQHNYLLDPTHNDEDAGKIFVFHLRKCEDKGGGDEDGDGELKLFCWDAEGLQSAVSQYRLGRQHRLLTSPLPPTPTSNYLRHLHWSRRLSRSEGDLRWPIPLLHRLHSSQSPSPSAARRNWSSSSRERNSNSLSSEKDTQPLGKVARSLILASASFGLLLSTPGCSEPDSLHEYQSLDYYNNSDADKNSHTDLDGTSSNDADNLSLLQSNENFNDDDDGGDILGELHSHEYFKNFSSPSDIMAARRVSGGSVASGIYAEIDESVADMTTIGDCFKFYENLKDSSAATSSNICSRSSSPPPLPPRRKNESINGYNEYVVPYSTTGGAQSTHSHSHTHQTDTQDEKTDSQAAAKQETFIEKNYVSITNENNLLFRNRKDMNETRDIQSSSPPSLPPRYTSDDCNIQKMKGVGSNIGKEEQTNAIERVTSTSRCGDEPDYLPMSQITYQNNDTYVVMANIIHNNKMSKIAVTESAP